MTDWMVSVPVCSQSTFQVHGSILGHRLSKATKARWEYWIRTDKASLRLAIWNWPEQAS